MVHCATLDAVRLGLSIRVRSEFVHATVEHRQRSALAHAANGSAQADLNLEADSAKLPFRAATRAAASFESRIDAVAATERLLAHISSASRTRRPVRLPSVPRLLRPTVSIGVVMSTSTSSKPLTGLRSTPTAPARRATRSPTRARPASTVAARSSSSSTICTTFWRCRSRTRTICRRGSTMPASRRRSGRGSPRSST